MNIFDKIYKLADDALERPDSTVAHDVALKAIRDVVAEPKVTQDDREAFERTLPSIWTQANERLPTGDYALVEVQNRWVGYQAALQRSRTQVTEAVERGGRGEIVSVDYDLSPAQVESALKDKLIELGWTPPQSQSVRDALEKAALIVEMQSPEMSCKLAASKIRALIEP